MNKKFKWFPVLLITIIFSIPAQALSAGIFSNDEANWKRMFGEIKKINSRLVSLEMGKMKAMQSSQEETLRQVSEMKSIVPDLRGTVEQNQMEMLEFIKNTEAKLKDLESYLKFEVGTNLKIQQEATVRLQTEIEGLLTNKFGELQTHLAGDMEKFSQTNKQNFEGITRGNSEALGKVVNQLNSQNQTLERTNAIFKTELIPAIMKENGNSRQALFSELAKVNKENQDAMLAGFTDSANKNAKMIEVLKLNFKESQETKSKVDHLNGLVAQVDGNVVMTQNTMVKLKDILTNQMQAVTAGQETMAAQVGNNVKNTDLINQNLIVADRKVNKLAESLQAIHSQNSSSAVVLASLQQNYSENGQSSKLVGEKVNALITTSKEMAVHSGSLGQSVQNLNQSMRNIEGGLAKVDIANQKLTKLIEIMRTMASDQSRVGEAINAQSNLKKAQLDIRKTQLEMQRVQAELKKAQAELARKTNVALARTDHLKKEISKK